MMRRVERGREDFFLEQLSLKGDGARARPAKEDSPDIGLCVNLMTRF